MTPNLNRDSGAWLLGLCAAVGLVLSAYYYLSPGNGIHGTPGTLLVTVSTALLVAAALALWAETGAIRIVLLVAALLDILGTAFAAYMLDAYILLALIAGALVGWFLCLGLAPHGRRSRARVAHGAAR